VPTWHRVFYARQLSGFVTSQRSGSARPDAEILSAEGAAARVG
jgi:hypothetical protein